jgi:parallel beta-helix repeat protein
LFTGVTSITVGSPITINGQNLIILGPGATAPNSAGVGAPSASSNLTISGGGSSQIFYVEAGSLMVDGLTLSGGVSSDNYGGAIENYGALSIVNTIFSGNGSTSTYGGAVYDQSATGATSAVAYSTFTGNKAEEGAAYYIEEYSESSLAGASFSHTLFTNNTASDGSSYGSGGAIYADWNLTVANSTFTGNVAGSTSGSGFDGEGGAIDIEYNSASTAITTSTFGGTSASAGNFAGGAGPSDSADGGAIYNDGDYPLVLSGNTFSNNVARGGDYAEGGAIEDFEGITSTGDTFTNNLADASAASGASSGYVYGGAVDSYADTTWTSDTFTSNQAKGGVAANGAIYGEAYGGAIYDSNDDPSILSASQTTFTSNSASAAFGCYGGAIDTYWSSTSQPLPLTNVQFTNNSCTANDSAYGAYALGGALYIQYGPISLESVTFTGNAVSASSSNPNYAAFASGGGFEYDGYYECDCAFKRHGAAPSQAALASLTAHLSADRTRHAQFLAHVLALRTLHANRKAKHAVQAVIHSRAPMATRRVQLSGGTAPSNGIDSSTFSNNTATASGSYANAYGGGADLSGQPTVTNSTFNQNSATGSGGGSGYGGGLSLCAYDYGAGQSISATITGNTATNGGGGIYLSYQCDETSVLNSTISGNSVTSAQYSGTDGGGGINNNSQYFMLSGSTLTGNTVSGSTIQTGGGGFFNEDDDAYVLNSTIYKNTSAIDGGGIENLDYGNLYLVNATIYQNTATGNGGGISNDPAGQGMSTTYVYSANSIIAGDSASGNGSDIWNLDQFISNGYNLVQQGSNYGSGTSNAPQTGDLIGVGPALASALANNGGPTQTIADTSSSPGKGVIPFANSECNTQYATNVDQRGYSRGAGGVCDIGAYEFSGTATTQQAITAKNIRNSMNLRRNH